MENEVITILASPQNLYTFWLNPQNFMAFTEHLESVIKLSSTKSRWKWKGRHGSSAIEWNSEIVEQKPFSIIEWRSTQNAEVPIAGRVEFVPLDNGRGTIVRLAIESPSIELKMNLTKLRELFEAGEIPRVEGQPAGAHRKHETITALH